MVMKLSLERFIYWSVWIFGVLYSLYCFSCSVKGNLSQLEQSDFDDGWAVLQRNKDISDMEWTVFKSAFSKCYYLAIVQIIFTQVVLANHKQYMLAFYTFYSFASLIFIIGPFATVVYVLYVLFMYFVHMFGYRSLCYFAATLSLYTFHQERFTLIRMYFVPSYTEGFLVDVGLVWLAARCLSFSLDRLVNVSRPRISIKELFSVMSYCLYLPTIFTGPLLIYESFAEQLDSHSRSVWTGEKLCDMAKAFSRPLFGYVLLEFLNHFVYSSAIQFYPDLVQNFDAWSLCGLGYALPLLFYLKYFIIYSLSSAFGKAECFEFPPPPKCISRVSLPSQLWRTFDRGLYEWILKYLYLPITGGNWQFLRKLTALTICFTFVCIWHGMDKSVCTWTLLNFFNLSFEIGMFLLLPSQLSGKYEKVISPCIRRLNALFSLPHFVIMCMSCIFFLANYEIGSLIFQKIILNVEVLPVLSLIMYCGCHVALDVKEFEDYPDHKFQV